MEKKLKVGIIGTGNISNMHMGGYKALSNVEVIACCDINKERAEEYAKRWGIKQAFGSVDEMLALEELDAVSVCVWVNGHCPEAVKALRAGKHVLCEKPLAMNTAEALLMKEEAEKAGKLLMVGFVRRHSTTAKSFLEFKEAGVFGEVYMAKTKCLRRVGNPGGWFANKAISGGGPLIDLGVHMIDISRYLLGNPKPVSVYGCAFEKLGAKNHIKGMNRYHPMDYSPEDKCDVEDNFSAMIRFENGIVLHAEASFSLNIKKDEITCEILGTKGGASIEPKLEIFTELNDYLVDISPRIENKIDAGTDMFNAEMKHFAECILEGKQCVATADDGVEIMRILDAIYESAATGHEVIIKR